MPRLRTRLLGEALMERSYRHLPALQDRQLRQHTDGRDDQPGIVAAIRLVYSAGYEPTRRALSLWQSCAP